MRFALMTEPQQGLTYEEILAVARAGEEAGFETFFRSDHYESFPEPDSPATDAWATLAGLARETSRIGLGTLVSPITFRLPGPFAKLVTTVDQMSSGRVEVGLGAGWNRSEHDQLGIPFPKIGERFDRLEEALAIVHGLWTESDGWSHEGRHWQLRGARFAPAPVVRDGRRHPNLIVGGEGKPRSLRLAAKYADEYNVVSARPETAAHIYARLAEACRTEGRDPDSVARSAMTGVLVAETDGGLLDRVQALRAFMGGGDSDPDAWLAERRDRWIMGTPDEARERIAAFEHAGVQRLVLQDFSPRDLDMVSLLGTLFA